MKQGADAQHKNAIDASTKRLIHRPVMAKETYGART